MDLQEWREKQNQTFELPSGLVATLRPMTVLDLAAQGEIPAPLAGLVNELMSQKKMAVTLDDFGRFGEIIGKVCKAAFVSPPVGDEPGPDVIGLGELGMADRLAVFNHAHQGLEAKLRPFRREAGEPAAAPPPG